MDSHDCPVNNMDAATTVSRGGQLFLTLIRSDNIKDHLFPYLSTTELCAIRAVSSGCCNLLNKRLFTRIHVSFDPSTFTKPSRVAALGRIGHLIEHLTFFLPHSEATFLPPLIHPATGREICFLYTPHTSMGDVLSRPKYANTELGDILMQQYPPLFHAATNVPSFINAVRMLPNMRHLTIRCPGQDSRERYRRDVVDYALISMRIAVERADLPKLNKLSLSSLHPAAFNYLRHVGGFGNIPSAGRKWRQIKKLHISVEAWDFYGPAPGLDHLKIIDDYIRTFGDGLEKFSFAWVGGKGPCPISLASDPLFAPPRASKKLFHEVTSPMSPLPKTPTKTPIHFPKLRQLVVRNATMNAPQLRALIKSHRKTVREFDFENVVLINNGNWDDALAPIDRDDTWSRSSLTAASECSFVSSESLDDLPSPSAAVTAASKELLDVDLGGLSLSDEEREQVYEPEPEVTEGLSEDIAAAKEASLSFTTKLKKKRIRRRKKHHHKEEDRTDYFGHHSPEQHSPSSHYHHRKPSRLHLDASPSYSVLRPQTPPPTQANITAPILSPNPHPVLLQPTVYDPASRQRPPSPDEGISPVQRNIEQEEAHRRLAEDAAARTSALQKAKEAVLSKLSREFCSKRGKAAEAVAACRLMANTGRDFGGGGVGCGVGVIVEDRRVSESKSVLVPLMLGRG